MKNAFGMIKGILIAVALVVAASEAEDSTPGSGSAKKAKAISTLLPVLAPVLPDFLEPVLAAFLPTLIDIAVSWANKTGFFDELSGK